MSLRAKIEAVIYASEEPVTLQQLSALLGAEVAAELDALATQQGTLLLDAVGAEGAEAGDAPETAEPMPDVAPGTPERADDASSAEGAPDDAGLPSSEEQAEPSARSETDAETRRVRERERAVRDHLRRTVDRLIRDYAESDRGIEIREVASGYRMGTKPEYHDAVRGFVKSLKPAMKLTLPALETLAVVAYKQPVTAAEISEIRGVDSAGVLGGLMARKLIATAGRKQVIGRPMLYRTTRDFLLRFGLKDVHELPSMDEFERMASELVEQEDLAFESTDMLIERANVRGDAEHLRATNADGDTNETSLNTEEAAASAESSPNDTDTQEATAETVAGGNHDRVNQSAEAATFDPTKASEPAGSPGGEAASRQTPTGEEAERSGEA